MFWVRELAKRLIEIPGVVAVTLGDSLGPMQRESEWAFGLYYRGAIRAEEVRALGFEGILVEPGQWGRLANGGGQLMVEGQPVDLRYRELDVVQCAGLLAKAAIEVAHAAFAERGEWVLTEKGIVRGAGLGGRVEGILAAPGDRPFELGRAVTAMRAALGIPPGAHPPTA